MSLGSAPVDRFGRSQVAILVGCLLLFVSLGLITGYQMRPWVDEAWYGVPGRTLANHGYFGSPSFDGSIWGLKDLDRYSYWVMPVFPLAQALWDCIFPQSLHSIRMVSTLSGVAGIACWAIFFLRLTESRLATVIFCALASADYVLTSAAGFGRPDMMAFMFQAAAFASYMVLRERRFAWAILTSQTCVVLSGLTHPNGGILSFLGVLFVILYLDRSRIRVRHFAVAAVPYLLGGFGWGLYILQDPSAFFAQYGYQTAGRFTGFAHPLRSISLEITRRYLPQMGLGINFYPFKAVSFLAEFIAIAAILADNQLRRQRAPKVLLGIVSVYLVFYVFLEGTKEDYYFSYLSTVYVGLLAFYLNSLWNQRPSFRPFLLTAIAGIMAVQVAGPILKLRRDPWSDYQAAAQWLQDKKKPSDLVFGSYELGFFLGFTPQFLDDAQLGLVNGRTPDFILMETIYDGRMSDQRAHDELKYRQLVERLSHYREIYRRGEYRVLVHETHAPVI